MLVTINTDASFHPKHKDGAFACWIVRNGRRIKQGGYFKQKCITSHEAEMKAIINALVILFKNEANLGKIIINTDSENSISVFTNDRKKIKQYGLQKYKSKRRKLNKMLSNHSDKITLEFRHVKAHSGVDDKRSYVNEWCDKTAKYYLWKGIHDKLKKKIVNFLAEEPGEDEIDKFYTNEVLPIDKRSLQEILNN